MARNASRVTPARASARPSLCPEAYRYPSWPVTGRPGASTWLQPTIRPTECTGVGNTTRTTLRSFGHRLTVGPT